MIIWKINGNCTAQNLARWPTDLYEEGRPTDRQSPGRPDDTYDFKESSRRYGGSVRSIKAVASLNIYLTISCTYEVDHVTNICKGDMWN